jgi:hypothetical protein
MLATLKHEREPKVMTSEEKELEQIAIMENDDEWLRCLSPLELESLGVNYIAYVKPITVDGILAYGIYSANGEQLGVSDHHDHALETIREQDLEALSLH